MRKGDAREAALLEAAEALLHRIAPAELTVEAIARRAQLTRTAFYFYFASKEEAIGRLAERYLGEIFAAAQPAFDPDIPLRDGARTAIENQVAVWGKHGRAVTAVADLAASDPAIRGLWTAQIEAFVEPVHRRMAAYQRSRGRRPSPHLRARAEVLVWMLERYYYVWASGHYRHRPRDVVETLFEMTMAVFDA
jgi:TetR/AcrR family transcriptional regulator, ethionamide resistance regulator